MHDENIISVPEELSTNDKIRLILFKNFSSNLFLILAILYTVNVGISILPYFEAFDFFTFVIGLIIPVIMMIGIWKIYTNAKGGKVVDTSGLRLVRGVMTFIFALLLILAGLMLLFALIGGLILFIIVIPLGIVAYAYYSFRMTITNLITGYEDGSVNTDHFNTTLTFLIITIIFSTIGQIIRYTVDVTKFIPDQFQDLIQQPSTFLIVVSAANMTISFVFTILLTYFVYKIKKNIENVYYEY